MGLSNDLVSQFVKITRDQTVEKRESIVYGTTVEYNSKMYVKIDGSDLITPVETTTDMQSGERVTVLIKDHTATVTGNISSPAPSTSTVTKIVQENSLAVEELIADKATIKDLEATNAEIENLKVKNAEIENLVANKATIKDLEATNAKIENLKTENAEIKNLVADKASIKDLEVINADIVSLKADRARIEVLEAEYADINTLVNGNLTSDNIQSLHLTSANTTIDNALIKDAMIDTVSANKINSGTINTNNVNIQSDDGSMLLQGNLQQFKDANGNVRIQIGKDASGNFSFVLYDESGTGQLINQNGIQSSNAIADGLIVDAKVAEGANISGSKLDISSVVTEINDGTTTIKGSKVYLDDKAQTLEVAFNSLSTTVENLKVASGDVGDLVEKITTNTTNIQIAQGQIETLITNTTITKENGEVIQLKDAYNSTVDTVNSHTTKIGSLETNYLSADNRITTVESKQTELEQSVDGFKQTVSKTYATKNEYSNLADDLHTNYSTTTSMNSAIEQKATSILSTVSSTYVTTDEMTGEVTTINNSISEVRQEANKISWLIKSGTSSSNMTLTDNALSVIANNINLTGKVTFSCLDNSTQNTINNASSNASTALSTANTASTNASNAVSTANTASTNASNAVNTANTAKSTADSATSTANTANTNATTALNTANSVNNTLNNNKDNWTNAYNRVVEWASSDVTGSTTINGGMLTTNTVLANKLAIGDFNNYSQLSKGSNLSGTFGTATWNEDNKEWYTWDQYFPFTVDHTQNAFNPNDIINMSLDIYLNEEKSMGIGLWFYDSNFGYIGESVLQYTFSAGYNHYSFDLTVPDNDIVKNAKYMLFLMNTGGVYVAVKNVVFRRKVAGNLLVDGCVTAEKIQGRELIGVTLRNASNTFSVDGEGNIIGASITNSIGGNWSIDTDGNMETKNMSIEGEISADEITCNKINNPNYPESLSGDIQLYVDATNGNDDIELEDGATFKTLNGALDALPRNLNNWVAKIMLQTNITENVTIRNINTGRLYIQLNNKTLYGWIDVVQNMGLQVFLLGGTTGTASKNDYGYIKPTEGKVRTGGVFPIAALDTFSFTLYNIAVYAPTVKQTYTTTNADGTTTTSTYTKGALHCSNFVKAYINNIKIYHTLSGSTFNTGFDNMVRSYSNAYVYIAESHGLSKNYTYYAQSGSTICLNNATQCGRYNSTARVNTNSAGEVRWSTEPTWDGSGTSGSSDAGTTVTTKTYTKTYKSTSGDTYRSTVYNNWKKDGTVRQGDYGYGDCNGYWFFGTQFADVKGKNITKVQITITRQTGGTSSAVGLAIKTHNYASRPSRSPSYVGSVGTLSIATGTSGTLSITSTSNALITGLKNGTIKGIGLQSSYTSGYYAVCSGTCTVKVTYTE